MLVGAKSAEARKLEDSLKFKGRGKFSGGCCVLAESRDQTDPALDGGGLVNRVTTSTKEVSVF